MPKPEHVAELRKGVVSWNAWRSQSNETPDLSGADLRGVDLTRIGLANAKGADLTYAVLDRADLSGALLRGADFTLARLRGTVLTNADLRETYFHVANLAGANLKGANICGADFTKADLTDADLTLAKIQYTGFDFVNLSTVTGLDTCVHLGPSDIGFRTLAQSGKLAPSFLRGCGLSDTVIDYLPSLVANALEFYSCFISYSSKDQEFANRLYADLQDRGVRCWFAPHDMRIGARLRTTIDESIKVYDKLLLILSEHSVSNQWVEQEVETALRKERQSGGGSVLFPVRLDDTVLESCEGWPALIKDTRHVGDFTRWKEHDSYQRAFERLLRDLKAGA